MGENRITSTLFVKSYSGKFFISKGHHFADLPLKWYKTRELILLERLDQATGYRSTSFVLYINNALFPSKLPGIQHALVKFQLSHEAWIGVNNWSTFSHMSKSPFQ